MRLEVSDGSVMKTDWSVNTGDGSIALRLPANLDAEIDAHPATAVSTPMASTASRRAGTTTMTTIGIAARTLGKGGRTLRLRSGDGSIDISR